MSGLKLFSGLGNSYSVLSDFPFWLDVMQFRTQLEREFAVKAKTWCKNVSDKLYILGQQNVDGIIQIHSALRMEVTKMEERAHFALVSSNSYEEAAKLLLNESETADEKLILRKYETSFQKTLNPYKHFFSRVEKGQKVYERSMVRLEKLVMDDTASWFSKKKIRRARKTAKRNSDKYIRLVKEKTNQGINIASLSKEYEEVASEIADKRVKSLIGCWSNCLSRLAENSTGETRDMFKKGEKMLNKVDSEMLIKLLSELNKESLNTPVYHEFQGTLDIQELLGYRPILQTDIHNDDVKSDTRSINASTKSSFTVDSQSLDSCDIIRNPFYGKKDKSGEENKENKPMTPADSYDRCYNPFCVNANEQGEEKKDVKENNLSTSVDSYDRLYNPFCSNAHEHGEENDQVEENNPITPGDIYDGLYNPLCSNDEHGDKNEVEENNPIIPAKCYDELYNPFCTNEDEHEEEKKEETKPLTPVDSCGWHKRWNHPLMNYININNDAYIIYERRLKRCVTAVVITAHTKKACLEMNIKPGDKVEQLTRPNSLGMVYGRKKSVITKWKMGGFIPSNCILPT